MADDDENKKEMKGVGDFFYHNETYENYSIKSSNGEITLLINSEVIMSDDNNTLRFYQKYIPKFTGDCLVVGLGLCLLGINFADKCASFDYLEKDKNLIDFIRPKVSGINFIIGDAFNWETDKRYDFIFLDIYNRLTPNFETEIKFLYNKYKSFLKKEGDISYLKIHGKSPV